MNDLDSWADYQAIEGSMDDEHVVASLQYVEEGLLTVDLIEGQGAFGDDLAIEILATDYQRGNLRGKRSPGAPLSQAYSNVG